MPRIGIPLALDPAGALRAGRRTLYLDAAVAEAVVRVGGQPVGLPPLEAPDLDRIDALVLPGGDDLLPDGAASDDPRFVPVAEAQLRADRARVAAARARGLPILGICYGMQLLALEAGGRLLYHLPDDVPESAHQCPGATAAHEIRIRPDCDLARLLGTTVASVNSRHHQAVAEPGAGYRTVACAADGVVEAIEATDGFALGVQWHPEDLDPDHANALFGALLDAAAARPEASR